MRAKEWYARQPSRRKRPSSSFSSAYSFFSIADLLNSVLISDCKRPKRYFCQSINLFGHHHGRVFLFDVRTGSFPDYYIKAST
jgi:hypothetical protein